MHASKGSADVRSVVVLGAPSGSYGASSARGAEVDSNHLSHVDVLGLQVEEFR